MEEGLAGGKEQLRPAGTQLLVGVDGTLSLLLVSHVSEPCGIRSTDTNSGNLDKGQALQPVDKATTGALMASFLPGRPPLLSAVAGGTCSVLDHLSASHHKVPLST